MPDDLDRFRNILFEGDELEEKQAPEPDDEYIPQSTQKLLDAELQEEDYDPRTAEEVIDGGGMLLDWFSKAYKDYQPYDRPEIEKKYSDSYLKGVFRRINERLERGRKSCRLYKIELSQGKYEVTYTCSKCGSAKVFSAYGGIENENRTLKEEYIYKSIVWHDKKQQCNECSTI
jgi:hypothetical protein